MDWDVTHDPFIPRLTFSKMRLVVARFWIEETVSFDVSFLLTAMKNEISMPVLDGSCHECL